MSPNLRYVHIGAKIHVSVSHTPRQTVRVYEIHLFFTPVRYSYTIADLVSSCAGRTLISVSARQPSISSVFVQRVQNLQTLLSFSFFIYFAVLLGQKDRLLLSRVFHIFSISNLPFLSLLRRCIAMTDK
jgi:hypothetical protein